MTGKGMLVPATAAFCSVTVCAVLGFGWYQTWQAAGWLRREIALARMDQQATLSALARERQQRATGLLATVCRPVAPEDEMVAAIQYRLPPALQVQTITATPESWQIRGVPRGATQHGSQTPPQEHQVYQLQFPRFTPETREAQDRGHSTHVAP